MSMGTFANGTSPLPINISVPSKLPIDADSSSANRTPPATHDRTLLIIDARALDRECFAQGLVAGGIGMNVLHFGSMDDYRPREQTPPLAAVVLNIGGRRVTDPLVGEEIRKLCSE